MGIFADSPAANGPRSTKDISSAPQRHGHLAKPVSLTQRKTERRLKRYQLLKDHRLKYSCGATTSDRRDDLLVITRMIQYAFTKDRQLTN